MKQTKKQKKHQKEAAALTSKVTFLYNKTFPEKYHFPAMIAAALLAAIAGLIFLLREYSSLGLLSFPLDDSWIHLTFARNLVEYGSFSYFKDQMVTSGSTAPIYTLLLAVLYFFSKNEFIISHILGIGFLGVGVIWIYKLLRIEFRNTPLFIIASIVIIAIQPHLIFISLAGMETSMYIGFAALAFYFYRMKMKWHFGIMLGLLIWCRPDAFVIWIAFLLDYLVSSKWVKSDIHNGEQRNEFTKKDMMIIYGTASGIVILYFLFNLALSGYFLPNTFRSKIAIYTNLSTSEFLKNDIVEFFSADEFMLIWIPFILSIFFIIRDLIQRRYNTFFVMLLFVIGLPLLYYIELPSASMYGRYLMPVVPFYIILAAYGVKSFIELLFQNAKSPYVGNFTFILYWASAIILSVTALIKYSDLYTYQCKYYHDRHMVVGRWIDKNVPESAVIATHDVGAIAFYGNRRVLDMVGLVNPGIIKEMSGNFTDFLNRYLIEQKVDYVATLRSWFEIVNDNPVFSPVQQPEILEIYKFVPGKTYIQNGAASDYINNAIQMMNMNDSRSAENYFLQALQIDPRSSRANFLLAYFYYSVKDISRAEQNLNKALEIFPESTDAVYLSALISYEKNEYLKAKETLEGIDSSLLNPQSKELLKEVNNKLGM